MLTTAKGAAANSALTTDQWIVDIDQFASRISDWHVEPWRDVPEADWLASVDQLRSRVPSLEGLEITTELSRLAAQIGDAHTHLSLGQAACGMRRLPLRFEIVDEGLLIRETTPEHEDLLGALVSKVAGMTAQEAIECVTPYSHADNDMTRRLTAAWNLELIEVLAEIGEVNDRAVEIDGVLPTGATLSRSIESIELADRAWVHVGCLGEEPPLWLGRREDPYWLRFLPESAVLYVQINSITNTNDHTMEAFIDELFASIDAEPWQRIVLDVRHCIGGSEVLIRPLVERLARDDRVNRPGVLVALIGRRSISATVVLVTELEKRTDAIFVGEPTGGSPNQYGQGVMFVLPNSGLRVSVATLFFQTAGPFDTRPWLAPSLAAAPSVADYRSGRDPALELALTLEPLPSLTELLDEALESGVPDRVIGTLDSFHADRRNRWVDTEREADRLGHRLLRAGDNELALRVFRMNQDRFPARARPLYSLAVAADSQGRAVEARAYAAKALELAADDASLHHNVRLRLQRALESFLATKADSP